MPLGGKALKKREQARDAKAGVIRDAGQLRKIQTAKPDVACAICGTIFKVTKKNADARIHCDSKHPQSTFGECFAKCVEYEREAAAEAAAATAAPVVKATKKKKKNATDNALLLEGLNISGGSSKPKKSGKK